MRETIKNRPTAKINNISFFNPLWQDERKTTVNNTPSLKARHLSIMVDSLRKTYNIYKEAALSSFPEPSRQPEAKPRGPQRKSLVSSAMYGRR